MATLLETSRTQVDRLLDPKDDITPRGRNGVDHRGAPADVDELAATLGRSRRAGVVVAVEVAAPGAGVETEASSRPGSARHRPQPSSRTHNRGQAGPQVRRTTDRPGTLRGTGNRRMLILGAPRPWRAARERRT